MRLTGKVRKEQGWESVESHGHRKASGLSVWGTFAQIKIITRNINMHTENKGTLCILTMLPHCIKKESKLISKGQPSPTVLLIVKTTTGWQVSVSLALFDDIKVLGIKGNFQK